MYDTVLLIRIPSFFTESANMRFTSKTSYTSVIQPLFNVCQTQFSYSLAKVRPKEHPSHPENQPIPHFSILAPSSHRTYYPKADARARARAILSLKALSGP